MLFAESTPFRRLAYYLTSPDFFARHDDNSFSPEDNKRYLRSVTSLRGHLKVLQRELAIESGMVEQAIRITESIHTVMPKLMENTGASAAGEYLTSLERHVLELGEIARSVPGASPTEKGGEHSFSVVSAPSWSSYAQQDKSGAVAGGKPDTAHAAAHGSQAESGQRTGTAQCTSESRAEQACSAASGVSVSTSAGAFAGVVLSEEEITACEELFAASAARHGIAATVWGVASCFMVVALGYVFSNSLFEPQEVIAAAGSSAYASAVLWGYLGTMAFFALPLFAVLLASLCMGLQERRMQAEERRKAQTLALYRTVGHVLEPRTRDKIIHDLITPRLLRR